MSNKIITISDTHFGARNDNQSFHDYFAKFYSEVFFPLIKEVKPCAFIHPGDIFDRRKYVNFNSLYQCIEYFFRALAETGIPSYFLIGNHDLYFRDSYQVSSKQLLGNPEFKNFYVIDSPQNVLIGGHEIAMVPWITPSNSEASLKFISETKALVGFGHMEIKGFAMYKGMINENFGLSANLFGKFRRFFSGHFHHRSNNGNIYYLGTPYEITWQDYDDPRGIHVFDLDSDELTFVENPHKMFHKLFYNDADKTPEEVLSEVGNYRDRYVKVIVECKTNEALFEAYLKRFEKNPPADLQTVENDIIVHDLSEQTIDMSDTLTIIRETVQKTETAINKVALEDYLVNLYHEAQARTSD